MDNFIEGLVELTLIYFLHSDVLMPVSVTLTSTSRTGRLVEDISVVNFMAGCTELTLVVNCSSSSHPRVQIIKISSLNCT